MTRNLTIDSLRGLLLVIMTINHLPGEHRKYTYDSLGYCTVAEGFVLLAGLMAGWTGTRQWRAKGEEFVHFSFWQRARNLYFYQLILLAFLFFVAVMLNAFMVSTPGTVSLSWQAYEQAWRNLLNPLFQNTSEAVLASALLIYQPPLFDILPLYCLFLFFTPTLLQGMLAWGWKPILGTSCLIWLGAQTSFLNTWTASLPANWNIHAFVFDPFAWQLLYVIGLVSGHLWEKRPSAWLPSNVTLWTMLNLCGLIYLLRHAPVSESCGVILGDLSYRETLAPLRLISVLILLGTVGLLALRFPKYFQSPPLSLLGRHSLSVFLYQIALVYAAGFWCDQLLLVYPGWPTELLCLSTLTASLWGFVWVYRKIRETDLLGFVFEQIADFHEQFLLSGGLRIRLGLVNPIDRFYNQENHE